MVLKNEVAGVPHGHEGAWKTAKVSKTDCHADRGSRMKRFASVCYVVHCYGCYIMHCYGLPQHALGAQENKRGVHLVSLCFRTATVWCQK